MSSQNQVRLLLVLVAVLLLFVGLRPAPSDQQNLVPSLVAQLHAQTAPVGTDVMFFPVGNQDVRKFVFWNRHTNQVYIYGGNGKFEEAWQVGELGKDMKKQ